MSATTAPFEREGLALRSRIETMRANLDAATALAHAREEPNAELRASILRSAGIPVGPEIGPGPDITINDE